MSLSWNSSSVISIGANAKPLSWSSSSVVSINAKPLPHLQFIRAAMIKKSKMLNEKYKMLKLRRKRIPRKKIIVSANRLTSIPLFEGQIAAEKRCLEHLSEWMFWY
jgi:hypothetical protein